LQSTLLGLTTAPLSKAASMKKPKQAFSGLGVLLLVLAGYALLPPSLQQLAQPIRDAAISSQSSSERQRLNGWDGKPEQLGTDSNVQGAAQSDQIDSTVRNPTNVVRENPTSSQTSENIGQAKASKIDESRQQMGTSQESRKAAAEKQSATGQPRGPPSVQNDRAQKSNASPQKHGQAETLLHGLLQEFSKDQYLSPAGLIYGPGSAEGHRLDHLRRHITDQPTRPGKHGVFDGNMQGALQTIDDAYKRAMKGQRTTTTIDRNRTIYTVDLGKRIGFVGGQDGDRRRNPMARRVQIVLEGKRIITAYPM